MSKLKPGGLAMLRRCANPANNGKIVTLIRHIGMNKFQVPVDGIIEMDAWQTDFDGPTWAMIPSGGRIPTEQLIPFDDPGDDAVDQMVQLLGKPTIKKEELHV